MEVYLTRCEGNGFESPDELLEYSPLSTYFEAMKKATCLLLLWAILLQAGGILFLCVAAQMSVKFSIQETLTDKRTKLERISISLKDYYRYRVEKNEIKLAGKMYDIKEITFCENHVELLAYHDKKEDGIVCIIKNLICGDESDNDFPLQIIKLIFSYFIVPQSPFPLVASGLAGSLHQCNPDKWVSIPADNFSPPPEVILT